MGILLGGLALLVGLPLVVGTAVFTIGYLGIAALMDRWRERRGTPGKPLVSPASRQTDGSRRPRTRRRA